MTVSDFTPVYSSLRELDNTFDEGRSPAGPSRESLDNARLAIAILGLRKNLHLRMDNPLSA